MLTLYTTTKRAQRYQVLQYLYIYRPLLGQHSDGVGRKRLIETFTEDWQGTGVFICSCARVHVINVTDLRSPFGSHPLVREEICLSQLNVSAAAKEHTDHSGEGEINQESFRP